MLVGALSVLVGFRRGHPVALGQGGALLGLASDHDGDVEPAGGDVGQDAVDERLLRDPDLGQDGAGPRRADAAGHQPAGVGVRPRPPGHGDALDRGQQAPPAGVGRGRGHRGRHQLAGLVACARLRRHRRSHAHADQDRGPGRDRHRRVTHGRVRLLGAGPG